MPSRTDRKVYVPNGTYHVFNRGVNKQVVFHRLDAFADYDWFVRMATQVKNEVPGITILAYAIMPNHFHFVLTQENSRDMPQFMKKLCQRYVRYYNYRYNRIGPLFQSRYQAARLRGKNRILKAIKYVLANPNEAGLDSMKTWRYVGKKL